MENILEAFIYNYFKPYICSFSGFSLGDHISI